MKKTVETLYRAMKANGYEWDFIIPNEEVVFVQKLLNLKGKTDDELYNLWNEFNKASGDLLDETEDKELFHMIRDYHITVLEIINQSKSFMVGIKY